MCQKIIIVMRKFYNEVLSMKITNSPLIQLSQFSGNDIVNKHKLFAAS